MITISEIQYTFLEDYTVYFTKTIVDYEWIVEVVSAEVSENPYIKNLEYKDCKPESGDAEYHLKLAIAYYNKQTSSSIKS